MTFTIMNKCQINIGVILLIIVSMFVGMVKPILFIYLSVILHEIGHLLMIKVFKGKINNITISPFGCILDSDISNIKDKKSLIMIDLGRNYY